MWYKAGTANFTNNSTIVTGTNTYWSTQVKVGDIFTVNSSDIYEIISIDSNTQITLGRPYTGTTETAAAYNIIRNFTYTTNADIATNLLALVNSWKVREDELQAWMAGTANGGTGGDGLYPLTDQLGNTYQVACPAHIEYLAGSSMDWAITAEDAVVDATNFPGEYSAKHHANKADASRIAAQAAQVAAETAQTNAANSASTAITKASEANTSASNATSSASAAASSASAASASASTATTKASEASTSESNAATSASAANTSKNAAASSALAASIDASTASTKASDASSSAAAAASSESAAAGSATAASTSETNAASSASAANTSNNAAASSAAAASTSASQASTSATDAANAATAAQTAKTAAETAQTAAEEARDDIFANHTHVGTYNFDAVLSSVDIPDGISRFYNTHASAPNATWCHCLTVKHSTTRGYQVAVSHTTQDYYFRNTNADGNSWQPWKSISFDDHNHDDTYLQLVGGTVSGNLTLPQDTSLTVGGSRLRELSGTNRFYIAPNNGAGTPDFTREITYDPAVGEWNIEGSPLAGSNRILTIADEGSGNGLDADTVDALHSTSFLRSDADDTATGKLTLAEVATTGPITVGDGTADTNLVIDKVDDDSPDHVTFKLGGVQVGEIGCSDTTWLRINNTTNKNIYTPRYIRADAGFFVDGTAKGINGSGNFIGGTIAGAADANVINWDTSYTHSQTAHAPSNAQKNSDITKVEIEAKLTGVISSHSHVGGGGGAVGGGADEVFYENGTNVTVSYAITSGKNAMSAGPITINTGVTVTVPTGSVWSIV